MNSGSTHKDAHSTNIRDRIEEGFGAWAKFITEHPLKVILGCLLIVGLICTRIVDIYVDTSVEVFLHEDDPIRITYNEFRNQFGREERAILILDTEDSIFTEENLRRLEALHKQLEDEVPKIQEVLSLYNARLTRGNEDELIVKDLLEDWPEDQAAIEKLKQFVMNHPTLRDQYLGLDDHTTLIFIETDAFTSTGAEEDPLAGFDDFEDAFEKGASKQELRRDFITGDENNMIVWAIDEVAAQHNSDNFQISASGTPHMNTILMTILMTDMGKFTISSLIAIALILAFLFRRFVMIFMPLLMSGIAVVCTFSIMAAIGIPFTVLTQIAPSFLLAVGVSNSVHIFAVFFQHLQRGHTKDESLVYSLQHTGIALAMTSFTTAGGLMSFSQAEIKPIADFGIVSAVGIMMVFILSVSLLPALIALLPLKKNHRTNPESHLNQRFLMWCAGIAYNKPWYVVAVSALLIGSTFYSTMQLRATHDPIKWFKEGHPFRVSMERMNDEFGGAMFLEVVIDTKKENGLHNPELLKRIEKIYEAVYAFNENGVQFKKALSIIDVNKELHQALNGNDPAFYKIPDNQQLIAQELLLFENSGSDDLEQVTDNQFSKARVTLRVPYVEASLYEDVDLYLYPEIERIVGDLGEVEFTGLMSIDIETTPAMIRSLINSYSLAFLVIAPLMMLLLGSIKTGLLSMVPNLTPIIIVLGFMQWFQIPLEAFTLLIGCIALGLAVDDTIHFMHNYQRFYRQTGNAHKAVEMALQSTGQAILFTTIVLTVAFFIYMMSSMVNLFNFGLLTGSCIALAFIGDVLLAPALMILKARHDEKKGETPHQA